MKLDVLIPRFDPAEPRSAIENMKLLADKSTADILAFIHDDVDIHMECWEAAVEVWLERHPKAGLVGFGGAVGLGSALLYKTPYQLQQLARYDYMSNQTDWRTHGLHMELPQQVVVLDGFSQIFRREAYEQMGGWQAALDLGLTFHMYDAFAACMMARLGWDMWALPVPCTHHGGRTSTTGAYDAWLHSQGVNGDLEIHQKAHKIIYNEFRDVLPLRLS